jgi:hypothetical protein
MQFELYSHNSMIKVSSFELLQCLRIAQVYGHAPYLDEQWWQSATNLYPNLVMVPAKMTNVEHVKGTCCDERDDFVMFQFTDGKQCWDMDMTALLSALRVAQHYQAIPFIDSTWWREVISRYGHFQDIGDQVWTYSN